MDANSPLGLGGQVTRIVVLPNPTSTINSQTTQPMTIPSAVASQIGQLVTTPSAVGSGQIRQLVTTSTTNSQATQPMTIPSAVASQIGQLVTTPSTITSGQIHQLVTIPSMTANQQVNRLVTIPATAASGQTSPLVTVPSTAPNVINATNTISSHPIVIRTVTPAVMPTVKNSHIGQILQVPTTVGTEQMKNTSLEISGQGTRTQSVSNSKSMGDQLMTNNPASGHATATNTQPIVSNTTVSSTKTLPLNKGQVGEQVMVHASSVLAKGDQNTRMVTANGQVEMGHTSTAPGSDGQATTATINGQMGRMESPVTTPSTSTNDQVTQMAGLPMTDEMDFDVGSCLSCEQLQKQVDDYKKEHTFYSNLKKKMILTDALIRKYNNKCQELELQQMKVDELSHRLASSKKDCKVLEEQLGKTLKEIIPWKREKIRFMEEYESNKKKMTEAQEALVANQAGLHQYRLQINEMDKEIATLKKDSTDAKLRAKNLQATLDKRRFNVTGSKNEAVQLRKEKRNLAGKFERAKETILRLKNALKENNIAVPRVPSQFLPKGSADSQDMDGDSDESMTSVEDETEIKAQEPAKTLLTKQISSVKGQRSNSSGSQEPEETPHAKKVQAIKDRNISIKNRRSASSGPQEPEETPYARKIQAIIDRKPISVRGRRSSSSKCPPSTRGKAKEVEQHSSSSEDNNSGSEVMSTVADEIDAQLNLTESEDESKGQRSLRSQTKPEIPRNNSTTNQQDKCSVSTKGSVSDTKTRNTVTSRKSAVWLSPIRVTRTQGKKEGSSPKQPQPVKKATVSQNVERVNPRRDASSSVKTGKTSNEGKRDLANKTKKEVQLKSDKSKEFITTSDSSSNEDDVAQVKKTPSIAAKTLTRSRSNSEQKTSDNLPSAKTKKSATLSASSGDDNDNHDVTNISIGTRTRTKSQIFSPQRSTESTPKTKQDILKVKSSDVNIRLPTTRSQKGNIQKGASGSIFETDTSDDDEIRKSPPRTRSQSRSGASETESTAKLKAKEKVKSDTSDDDDDDDLTRMKTQGKNQAKSQKNMKTDNAKSKKKSSDDDSHKSKIHKMKSDAKNQDSLSDSSSEEDDKPKTRQSFTRKNQKTLSKTDQSYASNPNKISDEEKQRTISQSMRKRNRSTEKETCPKGANNNKPSVNVSSDEEMSCEEESPRMTRRMLKEQQQNKSTRKGNVPKDEKSNKNSLSDHSDGESPRTKKCDDEVSSKERPSKKNSLSDPSDGGSVRTNKSEYKFFSKDRTRNKDSLSDPSDDELSKTKMSGDKISSKYEPRKKLKSSTSKNENNMREENTKIENRSLSDTSGDERKMKKDTSPHDKNMKDSTNSGQSNIRQRRNTDTEFETKRYPRISIRRLRGQKGGKNSDCGDTFYSDGDVPLNVRHGRLIDTEEFMTKDRKRTKRIQDSSEESGDETSKQDDIDARVKKTGNKEAFHKTSGDRKRIHDSSEESDGETSKQDDSEASAKKTGNKEDLSKTSGASDSKQISNNDINDNSNNRRRVTRSQSIEVVGDGQRASTEIQNQQSQGQSTVTKPTASPPQRRPQIRAEDLVLSPVDSIFRKKFLKPISPVRSSPLRRRIELSSDEDSPVGDVKINPFFPPKKVSADKADNDNIKVSANSNSSKRQIESSVSGNPVSDDGIFAGPSTSGIQTRLGVKENPNVSSENSNAVDSKSTGNKDTQSETKSKSGLANSSEPSDDVQSRSPPTVSDDSTELSKKQDVTEAGKKSEERKPVVAEDVPQRVTRSRKRRNSSKDSLETLESNTNKETENIPGTSAVSTDKQEDNDVYFAEPISTRQFYSQRRTRSMSSTSSTSDISNSSDLPGDDKIATGNQESSNRRTRSMSARRADVQPPVIMTRSMSEPRKGSSNRIKHDGQPTIAPGRGICVSPVPSQRPTSPAPARRNTRLQATKTDLPDEQTGRESPSLKRTRSALKEAVGREEKSSKKNRGAPKKAPVVHLAGRPSAQNVSLDDKPSVSGHMGSSRNSSLSPTSDPSAPASPAGPSNQESHPVILEPFHSYASNQGPSALPELYEEQDAHRHMSPISPLPEPFQNLVGERSISPLPISPPSDSPPPIERPLSALSLPDLPPMPPLIAPLPPSPMRPVLARSSSRLSNPVRMISPLTTPSPLLPRAISPLSQPPMPDVISPLKDEDSLDGISGRYSPQRRNLTPSPRNFHAIAPRHAVPVPPHPAGHMFQAARCLTGRFGDADKDEDIPGPSGINTANFEEHRFKVPSAENDQKPKVPSTESDQKSKTEHEELETEGKSNANDDAKRKGSNPNSKSSNQQIDQKSDGDEGIQDDGEEDDLEEKSKKAASQDDVKKGGSKSGGDESSVADEPADENLESSSGIVEVDEAVGTDINKAHDGTVVSKEESVPCENKVHGEADGEEEKRVQKESKRETSQFTDKHSDEDDKSSEVKPQQDDNVEDGKKNDASSGKKKTRKDEKVESNEGDKVEAKSKRDGDGNDSKKKKKTIIGKNKEDDIESNCEDGSGDGSNDVKDGKNNKTTTNDEVESIEDKAIYANSKQEDSNTDEIDSKKTKTRGTASKKAKTVMKRKPSGNQVDDDQGSDQIPSEMGHNSPSLEGSSTDKSPPSTSIKTRTRRKSSKSKSAEESSVERRVTRSTRSSSSKEPSLLAVERTEMEKNKQKTKDMDTDIPENDKAAGSKKDSTKSNDENTKSIGKDKCTKTSNLEDKATTSKELPIKDTDSEEIMKEHDHKPVTRRVSKMATPEKDCPPEGEDDKDTNEDKDKSGGNDSKDLLIDEPIKTRGSKRKASLDSSKCPSGDVDAKDDDEDAQNLDPDKSVRTRSSKRKPSLDNSESPSGGADDQDGDKVAKDQDKTIKTRSSKQKPSLDNSECLSGGVDDENGDEDAKDLHEDKTVKTTRSSKRKQSLDNSECPSVGVDDKDGDKVAKDQDKTIKTRSSKQKPSLDNSECLSGGVDDENGDEDAKDLHEDKTVKTTRSSKRKPSLDNPECPSVGVDDKDDAGGAKDQGEAIQTRGSKRKQSLDNSECPSVGIDDKDIGEDVKDLNQDKIIKTRGSKRKPSLNNSECSSVGVDDKDIGEDVKDLNQDKIIKTRGSKRKPSLNNSECSSVGVDNEDDGGDEKDPKDKTVKTRSSKRKQSFDNSKLDTDEGEGSGNNVTDPHDDIVVKTRASKRRSSSASKLVNVGKRHKEFVEETMAELERDGIVDSEEYTPKNASPQENDKSSNEKPTSEKSSASGKLSAKVMQGSSVKHKVTTKACSSNLAASKRTAIMIPATEIRVSGFKRSASWKKRQEIRSAAIASRVKPEPMKLSDTKPLTVSKTSKDQMKSSSSETSEDQKKITSHKTSEDQMKYKLPSSKTSEEQMKLPSNKALRDKKNLELNDGPIAAASNSTPIATAVITQKASISDPFSAQNLAISNTSPTHTAVVSTNTASTMKAPVSESGQTENNSNDTVTPSQKASGSDQNKKQTVFLEQKANVTESAKEKLPEKIQITNKSPEAKKFKKTSKVGTMWSEMASTVDTNLEELFSEQQARNAARPGDKITIPLVKGDVGSAWGEFTESGESQMELSRRRRKIPQADKRPLADKRPQAHKRPQPDKIPEKQQKTQPIQQTPSASETPSVSTPSVLTKDRSRINEHQINITLKWISTFKIGTYAGKLASRIVNNFSHNSLDLLPIIYARCVAGNTTTEPLLIPVEERLINALMEWTKKNECTSLVDAVLSKLRQGLEYPITQQQFAKMSTLIRMFVLLCRHTENLQRARVCMYDIVRSSMRYLPRLILASVGTWPVICKQESLSPILAVIETVTMRRLSLDSNPQMQTVQQSLCSLCGWSPFKEADIPKLTQQLVAMIQDANVAQLIDENDANPALIQMAFELSKALELLASAMGWEWSNDTLIREHLWPVLKKWSDKSVKNGSACLVMKVIANVGILGLTKHKQSVSEVMKTLLAVLKQPPNIIPWCVQLYTADAILHLSASNPSSSFPVLQKWQADAKQNIPQTLAERMDILGRWVSVLERRPSVTPITLSPKQAHQM